MRVRWVRALPIVLLAMLGIMLSACASPSGPDNVHRGQARSTPTVPPVSLTFSPGNGTRDFDPTAPVAINASRGTIESVAMTNQDGKEIPGIVTPDRLSWKPKEVLGYSKTYTLRVTTKDTSGKTGEQTSTFSTIAPSNQTQVYFETTGGQAITDGGTYGVGMVIVAHFDEPIADKAAAERRLKVTANPPVSGGWNWTSDSVARWRPKNYWTPGTKITVSGNMFGAQLGDGLFGQSDQQVSFTIGARHISVADDKTHMISVYNGDQLVRTMPTSMGMGGTENIGGQTLSFWTPSGVYTVMDKANPVIMDSSTYGLPVNSRLGYRQSIKWATRISSDGIYLHQLDSTIWAQGKQNTSHGCLNLNGSNAEWFYNFSVPGDVVEVKNTGGPGVTLGQGGDWSVPWNTWLQGSALGS